MLAEVHRLLEAQPLLAELRARHPAITVEGSSHELSVRVGSIEARIQRPEWWEPWLHTREDWTRRLAHQLALRLLDAWDKLER